MIIRREHAADHAASRAVQVAAFGDGAVDPVEAALLDELRECEGWLPALSWVAVVDEQIVGHNVCTRGYVGDVPCVGLGPIAVAPDCQHVGVGSALMHAMIGAADGLGEPLIALLGNPTYYARFGFVRSTDLDITPPEPAWDANFQVLALTAWNDLIKGPFRYAAPFEEI